MAKFTFRLEKVKQVKTIYEEQAKLDWAAANRRLSTSIERLNHLYSKRSNASQYGYDQLDVSLRLSLYNYLNKMDRIIENQIEIVTTIKHEVEKKRNRWNKARQEKQVLERLEERQYEAFLYEQFNREQKELDEIKNLTPRV